MQNAGFFQAQCGGLCRSRRRNQIVSRKDLLIELAGTLDDEDTTFVERAEERANRFDDYPDDRLADATSAEKGVRDIMDGIDVGRHTAGRDTGSRRQSFAVGSPGQNAGPNRHELRADFGHHCYPAVVSEALFRTIALEVRQLDTQPARPHEQYPSKV
jgi:hypothetical protein